MRKVLQFLSRQLEVLKVREKINSQVQEEMGRNQREYVLRQQLKAIKEELGEIDETGGDLDDFREKDRKSTRLNSSHPSSSYAVFCLKKKSPTVSRIS